MKKNEEQIIAQLLNVVKNDFNANNVECLQGLVCLLYYQLITQKLSEDDFNFLSNIIQTKILLQKDDINYECPSCENDDTVSNIRFKMLGFDPPKDTMGPEPIYYPQMPEGTELSLEQSFIPFSIAKLLGL